MFYIPACSFQLSVDTSGEMIVRCRLLIAGPIPEELGRLVQLKNLYLGKNKLDGEGVKWLRDGMLKCLWFAKTFLLHSSVCTFYGICFFMLMVAPSLACKSETRRLSQKHMISSLLRIGGDLTNPPDHALLVRPGPIPRELGSLMALTHLGLSNNRLTGEVPSRVKTSKIGGSLPKYVLVTCPIDTPHLCTMCFDIARSAKHVVATCYLRTYSCSWTQSAADGVYVDSGPRRAFFKTPHPGGLLPACFAGHLPEELGNLGQLEELDLHYNRLAGKGVSWLRAVSSNA